MSRELRLIASWSSAGRRVGIGGFAFKERAAVPSDRGERVIVQTWFCNYLYGNKPMYRLPDENQTFTMLFIPPI